MNNTTIVASDSTIGTFDTLLKELNIYSPEPLYKVICPFHADKNASLQINRETGFFYCYGCGAKGTSFDLVKLQHNEWNDLSCIAYIKRLERNGKNASQKRNSPINNNIYNIYNVNNKHTPSVKNLSFTKSIRQSKNYYDSLPFVDWFKPNKNPAIAEETKLCINYMQNRGFTKLTLKKCGAKPSINTYYPICIPLLENGKFMGYVLRTFDPNIEQERKYMYNRGFRRERTLAGRYTKGQPLVVVEGYLDCLKAQQLGVKNVAALLGWKMSQTQYTKIRKYNIPLLLCALDNDQAGRKGFRYLKLIAKAAGIKVKRICYPKGMKDFGDLTKGSKEAKSVLDQINNYTKGFV